MDQFELNIQSPRRVINLIICHLRRHLHLCLVASIMVMTSFEDPNLIDRIAASHHPLLLCVSSSRQQSTVVRNCTALDIDSGMWTPLSHSPTTLEPLKFAHQLAINP